MAKTKGPRILRFEGHDYEIQDQPHPSGAAVALRKGDKPQRAEGEAKTTFLERLKAWRALTPNSAVVFDASELKDSGEGWLYLPTRVGPPLGGDFLENPDGSVKQWLIPPHPFRDIIRQHPLYLAGRDDLAREKVGAALNA